MTCILLALWKEFLSFLTPSWRVSVLSVPLLWHRCCTRGLCAVYLALADSYELYVASLPATIFAAEVKAPNQPIPEYVQQALSLQFVEEWGPAIDRENVGFLNHDCFAPDQLPPNAHVFPGLWVFPMKRDNTAKSPFLCGRASSAA